jgi:hypothetical protein
LGGAQLISKVISVAKNKVRDDFPGPNRTMSPRDFGNVVAVPAFATA